MSAVSCPPKDFKGGPDAGSALYYCNVKGCNSLWGVFWTEPETSRRLMTLGEYKTLATGKICWSCTKPDDRLALFAENWSGIVNETLRKLEKNTKEGRKRKREDLKRDTSLETKLDDNGHIEEDTASKTEEDEVWELVEHHEADESWVLL
ncbi:hypothetical protein A1O1_05664 [Capronia coronata CBS 617.96]|uniref:Uncharacterized protein n=1 Tax=Capronia coronata CBS 617.96 TaxID=1182541 RepID=W9Y7B0_9EURO|nr:uncharacterized protein A1O1_05664 [Capronia coronata CBS 617.96]EXJ88732.1 hypothetical protein A1O1_05664 [Capronia coronata CBS 617.96]